jgi:aminoglycoside phosphotransferase (APT) family kinase protein
VSATPPALVDEHRVSTWLEQQAGVAGPLRGRPLGGGNSNATFLLDGPGGSLVLRRPPQAALSGTAHSMAREYQVLRALDGTAVRAPSPVAYCDDAAVTGAPFLVMEHFEGVSITDRLPEAYETGPDTVRRLGEEMVDALAELHSVDWQAVGLDGFGKPERFLERQVPRWSKQFDSYRGRELPRFDQVAGWLDHHRPPEGRPAIMHGDFHLDNCLFSPTEPRLLAIIDWELATIGDPLLDLGLALAFWGPRPIHPCAMPAIQAVSRLPGAPAREDLARRYAHRSGRPVDELTYYMVLAFWKLAAIVEGAYAQFLDGRLATDYARQLAGDVPRLLEEAARLAGLP